jgi:prophage DNA circulation protein
MAILDKVVPASFKGYPFWVRSENVPSLGRRVVLHDFVNSGERYAEDLGSIPSEFEVDGFIFGENWYQNSRGFEAVLNEEGPGELFLPSVGRVEVYAMQYSRSVAQTGLGEVTYSLRFTRGRTLAGPSLAEIDEQTVYDRGFTAREALADRFSAYSMAPQTAANANVFSFDGLAGVAEAVNGLVDSIPVSQIVAVTTAAQNVYRNVNALIRDPGAFALSILGETGVWTALAEGLWVGNAGVQLAPAFSRLIGLTAFGAGLILQLSDIARASRSSSPTIGQSYTVPLWPATTYERDQRNLNRLAVVRANRTAALVSAYEVGAARTYATEDELIQARAQLENAHEQIMRIDVSNPDVLQADPVVRQAVEDVRLAALAVMDGKRSSVYRVDSIGINRPTPSLLTSYSLYAEQFRTASDMVQAAEGVRGLNPALPSNGLSGTVSVFTRG